jgi:hypothetical protein
MANPQLAALLPVEDVLQSLATPDRRLTLHRVFFDLYAASFPAQARIPVALALCGGAGSFAVSVRLLDPGGREIARDTDNFTASAVHVHLLTLNAMLEMPGEYRLEAFIEEESVMAMPLVVALSAPASSTSVARGEGI